MMNHIPNVFGIKTDIIINTDDKNIHWNYIKINYNTLKNDNDTESILKYELRKFITLYSLSFSSSATT